MNRRTLFVLAIAAMLLLLCAWATRSITEAPIESDGAANLLMSVNLAHHGTISQARVPPSYAPSMYREPLPVIVAAGAIKIVDALLGAAPDVEQYFSGRYAQAVKYHNVAWLLLLLTGMFVAVRQFTGSVPLAAASMLLVFVKIPATPTSLAALGIDTMETELAAAGLLLWGSTWLARAVMRGRAMDYFVAGLFFGALALTKAAFLYIFVGAVAGIWLLGLLLRAAPVAPGRGVPQLVLLVLGCAAMILPWMLRNQIQLGTFAVTQRGGLVLLFRAEKNLMTADEYRGTFYIWAPEKLQPLMGRLLGYSQADWQRNGRLQHIYREANSDHFADDYKAEMAGKPAEALTYYHRVRAQREQLVLELGTTPEATVRIDEMLQRRAVALIKAHPWRHLALTIPFTWRGAFTLFPILAVAFAFGLVRRRSEVAVFVLPALGMVLFYALFSHFTPRYGAPAVGVGLVAALTLAYHAAQLLSVRRRDRGAHRAAVA